MSSIISFFAKVVLVLFIISSLISIPVVLSFTVGRRNIEYVKDRAPAFYENMGYEIVGYEGYQHGIVAGGGVWHMLQRPGSPTLYSAKLIKWGGELHLYGPRALNAIEVK